ncbi:type I DNA topoisomerase [Mycoplasma sp. 1654_15]|uniref:type I DNA topoisomerase n=1 Tax=Mycoplasma sp. 1654_15 TaxID=2725994 RepID=UPI0015807F3D|nr:type I DNA topoisomerase [Mycoplasma sp. 1654_15]
MSKLVIVESPNKIKTISKYLGEGYKVVASVGHVVNLKTSGTYGLGIDMQNWEPVYEVESDKKEIVKSLKEDVKNSEMVIIATDADREGEAIGHTLVDLLKIEDKYQRIKYNEITESAILQSLEHPLKIDTNLVNAQKSRRMIDRIIGFRLSNLLAAKIKNTPITPSAGRVQSVALKLVIDREKEINAFVPYHYFTISAFHNKDVEIKYYNPENENPEWVDLKDIDKIYNSLKGNLVLVDKIIRSKKDAKITPLKQSALFKKASNWAASSVSASLQRLYEGFGDQGLISYPRTDSTRLSQTFIDSAKSYIEETFGKEYVSDSVKGFSGDQDAHEAIRPTDCSLTPELAKEKYELKDIDFKIYQIVYNTTMQAIMSVPERQITRYEFLNKEHKFYLSGSIITFDGYFKLTKADSENTDLPKWNINDEVEIEKYEKEAHQTNPPARYTDGSLIEKLDEVKVGRPSTFASSAKILQDRLYVEKQNKSLVPTAYGQITLDKLLQISPSIINTNYTAQVEEELDEIAEGNLDYKKLMSEFWENFQSVVQDSFQNVEKTQIELEKVGENCPECSSELIYRNNKKTGARFIGCSNFPNCRFIKQDPNYKPKFKRFYKKQTNETK